MCGRIGGGECVAGEGRFAVSADWCMGITAATNQDRNAVANTCGSKNEEQQVDDAHNSEHQRGRTRNRRAVGCCLPEESHEEQHRREDGQRRCAQHHNRRCDQSDFHRWRTLALEVANRACIGKVRATLRTVRRERTHPITRRVAALCARRGCLCQFAPPAKKKDQPRSNGAWNEDQKEADRQHVRNVQRCMLSTCLEVA